jgi:ankyrin repeat protein
MIRPISLAGLVIALSMVTACAGGLITPSHHITEEYNNAFAAASGGDLVALGAAIDKDPALIKATEWERRTLLHDAVDKLQMETTEFLLDENCDVDAVTKDGRTALHMAAQHGAIPMITLLLAHGAKIDPIDSKGWTPLDRAVKWGHADAVDYLREHGGHEH